MAALGILGAKDLSATGHILGTVGLTAFFASVIQPHPTAESRVMIFFIFCCACSLFLAMAITYWESSQIHQRLESFWLRLAFKGPASAIASPGRWKLAMDKLAAAKLQNDTVEAVSTTQAALQTVRKQRISARCEKRDFLKAALAFFEMDPIFCFASLFGRF